MIYLDHAATTPTAPEVQAAMEPYYNRRYGNASTVYEFGKESRQAVEHARETIAKTLGVQPCEIFFTSGGTESDNWALKATMEAYSGFGRHLITTSIEHHAIGNTCHYLKKNGYEVTELPVDRDGRVNLEQLERAIRPDTILLSIMCANNEIGTLQDMEAIGEIARRKGVLFHTDAVQAYGHIPIDVNRWNVHMLSASSHKFYGPKGCGFLYIKRGVRTESLIHGGAQESGKRAGTENVPGIVGMSVAAKRAYAHMEEEHAYETSLRDRMIGHICREIPGAVLVGSHTHRLPGNINICFQGVEASNLVLLLDEAGICVSAGSACNSASPEPSHVLRAVGLSDKQAFSCIRMTLGKDTTETELRYTLNALKHLVKVLRKG
ncbi:MAG: cysteine desulfurase family protein [bacterium]|nr:cysteine desulfurase family protein [bacterium]